MLERLDRLGQTGPFQLRLELLVRNNTETLEHLRGLGLTWIQIARGLPNWKQRSGGRVTADQLRGVYARTTRKSATATATATATAKSAQLLRTGDQERATPTSPGKAVHQIGKVDGEKASTQAELLRARLLRVKRVRG